jgi:hypothetical protein
MIQSTPVILYGGAGTRLWSQSRSENDTVRFEEAYGRSKK